MAEDRPNVLVIQSDEHSFRYLGNQPDRLAEPVATPTLDELAEHATDFSQTYCQMPLCTPSRLCMLTGREVRRCNGWNNTCVLPPDLPTIPSTFRDAGYATGLVGKMHLGGSRQFVGFEDRPYGDLTGATGHQWEPLDREGGRLIGDRIPDAGVTEIPESKLQEHVSIRESLAWIREHEAADDRPWFHWTSLSRPHFPLTAPQRYFERYWKLDTDEPTDRLTDPKVGPTGDSRDHPMTVGAREGFETADVSYQDQQRARSGYLACVEFLDDVVGDFLANLERDDILEDTIIVYVSDHGELAGEHGLWWKHTWHEAATRVPLFVQTPFHRSETDPTARIETPTSLADVFPTLCGLTGIEAPDGLDGVDLTAAVRNGAEPDRPPVVCDNLIPRWGDGTEFRLLREGQYKYIRFRDGSELLFDVIADPYEQEDLTDDPTHEKRCDHLRAQVLDAMDFDAAAAERERDQHWQQQFSMDVETVSDSGNCYHTRADVVIDADQPLYAPHVVTEDPEHTFSDYPQ